MFTFLKPYFMFFKQFLKYLPVVTLTHTELPAGSSPMSGNTRYKSAIIVNFRIIGNRVCVLLQ